MASLVEVNKTLESIKSDTTNLNKNFDAWFKSIERSKGDELERERERMRLMKAMAAAAGAAGAMGVGSGTGTGQKGPGGGFNPLAALTALWNSLPTWAKFLLIPAVAPVKTFRAAAAVVTAPQRLGEAMGRKAGSIYDQYAERTKRDVERVKLERAEFEKQNRKADQLAELEFRADNEADKARAEKARKARIAAYLKGRDEYGLGQRLFRDQLIKLENEKKTRDTLRFLQNESATDGRTAAPKALGPVTTSDADLPTSKIISSGELSVPTGKVTSLDFKAMSINDILPTLDLANRTRADLDVMVGNDMEMKKAIQSVENQKGVKFVMQKNGMIAAFKIVNGKRQIMQKPELENAINSLRDATSKVVNNKIKTNGSDVGGKVKAGFGGAFAAVEIGSVVDESLRNLNVTGSVMDPKNISTGAFSAEVLANLGGSFGDFSDMVYALHAAYKGVEYTPEYGKKSRDVLKDTAFIKWLSSTDILGSFSPGSKTKALASGAAAIEENIGRGAMRLAMLLGGASFEDIAKAEGTDVLRIDKQLLNAQIELFNAASQAIKNTTGIPTAPVVIDMSQYGLPNLAPSNNSGLTLPLQSENMTYINKNNILEGNMYSGE